MIFNLATNLLERVVRRIKSDEERVVFIEVDVGWRVGLGFVLGIAPHGRGLGDT